MAQAGTSEHTYGPYGEETAFLVIDVQNGVVEQGWDRDRVLEQLAALIDRARTQGIPVIYVQHESDDDLVPGTDPWRIHQRVAPRDGETIVVKRYNDAFADTTLPEVLQRLETGHLVIAGAQTDACIRATVHRAMGLGYDVTLAADCHTTNDFDWDGVSVTAEQIVGHFNLAIRYTAYPGQRIEVLPQADIALRRPAVIR
jgi:nicotinamidase-related amidase